MPDQYRENSKAAPGGASGGSVYGLRFLHTRAECVSLGFDVDLMKPADKKSDSAEARTTRAIDSSSVLGVIRLGVVEGDLRPFFLLGMGVHFTNVRIEATPKPGFQWIDTGTTEKRTLMDADGRALAIKIQGGADYAFNDNFLAGAFLAWNSMGSANYDATDQGKAAGLAGGRGSMSAITFGINLSGRF